MRSILFRPSPERENSLNADLWEIGMAGIVEEENGFRAFFEDTADLTPLFSGYQSLILEIRNERPRDWTIVSREGWDPIFAGERFFIVPPWLDQETPPGRTRLVIDTGMAFGSGRHESTQLMIQALEACLKPGDSVLDVGCGSGILSAVAEVLGAGRLLACDIDYESVKRSRLHTNAPAFAGSAAAVADGFGDIVAVNISAAAIDSLAVELRRVAKPGAILLLAGFIEENPPHSFHPDRVLQMNEWQCWICYLGCTPS
jgi:ribosomal protein L11 methyltransferase